jgi:hypothetical protein
MSNVRIRNNREYKRTMQGEDNVFLDDEERGRATVG